MVRELATGYHLGLTHNQLAGSIVMVGRPEVLGAGQHPDEAGGIMNEHREMLGTDRQTSTAIVQMNQRGLFGPPVTRQAGIRGRIVAHGTLAWWQGM